MSDTSLVFNLVARDETGQTLQGVREKFDAAATGIAAGVAGGLGVGVAAALDMSAANAKLAAQLGVGPAEAAELSKVSASVYANAWGDSTETVNNAIRGVYQNIGDTSKVEGGLEGATTKALALAETFDQEVGPTTAAVGQLMKTGLAKDADEAFDIITSGMQKGANRSDDFLDTIIGGADNLKTFGFTGQQATGLIVQGMNAGAESADSVVGLFEELVGNVAAGGDDLAQTFNDLGLDAQQMSVDLTSGGPAANKALDTLLDSIRSLKDPIKQDAMMAALFGEEGAAMQNTLMAIDPSSAVSALGEIEGSTAKVAKTMGESPASALESFKRQAIMKLADVSGTFIQFATKNQGVFEPLAYSLGAIALAVLAIKGGMMAWAAAQAVWTGATAIATAAQWAWNAAFAASGIGAIIMAVTLLIAAIVVIALKTTWFQDAWHAAWGGITTAFNATVEWFKGAIAWFGELPGKFAGWFGAAKDWAIGKFMELVNWNASLPGRMFAALAGLAGALRNRASAAFQAMRNAAADKASALMSWATGIPGRIGRAVTGMNNLLYDKGADVIHGLWNGISSMGGWLWSKVTSFVSSNVVDAAKSFLHIGSPSKLMADAIGQWIPAGIAVGAEGNRGVLDKTMAGLIDPALAAPTRPLTTGMAPLMGAQAGGGALLVRFEFAGADSQFKTFLQKIVRVEGRGNVQTAFGQ